MKQLFRLIKVFICARFRAALGVLDEGETHFLVWPNDLDPLMHMNNGVYLTLLDLGRIDLMIRNGLFKAASRNGIYPVVASEAIKFRRSLEPFSKFSIRTKTVYWDEKYFFIEQRFIQKGEVAASALVKGRFLRKGGGGVAPAELLHLMDYQGPRPQASPLIQNFLRTDADLR
jgi:acyl-CoA thioesterase FadM